MMRNHLSILLISAMLWSVCAGCAPKTSSQWELSQTAYFTYGVLLLDVSVRNNDDIGILGAADALIASHENASSELTVAATKLLMGREAATARALLRKCVQAYPKDLSFRVLLADASFALGENDEAVKTLRDFVSATPDTSLGRQELGLALYRAERFDEAIDVFNRLSTDDRTPYIKTAYGHMMLMRKEYAQAERLLLQGIREGDRPSPGFVTSLVSSMLDAKAYRLADRYMTQVLATTNTPDHLLTLFGAIAAFENHRNDRALALLAGLPDGSPDTANAVLLHAHILNEIGFKMLETPGNAAVRSKNARTALPLLKKAVTLAPDNPYILDSLAWAKFKCGDLHGAYADILDALAMSDGAKEAEIWDHCGDIAASLGLPKEAIAAWRKVIELDATRSKTITKKLRKWQRKR